MKEGADKKRNQAILHKVKNKFTQLELEIREKLTFQDQWGSQWSRVYTMSNEGDMTEELKTWAVETMIKFHKTLKPRLDKILQLMTT